MPKKNATPNMGTLKILTATPKKKTKKKTMDLETAKGTLKLKTLSGTANETVIIEIYCS